MLDEEAILPAFLLKQKKAFSQEVTYEVELKAMIIDSFIEEIDLDDPVQVEFLTWLIWSLGESNN